MPICLRAAINPSEIDVQEDLSCLSSKDHFPRRKQKTIARDANRRSPVLLSSNCYCCSDSLDQQAVWKLGMAASAVNNSQIFAKRAMLFCTCGVCSMQLLCQIGGLKGANWIGGFQHEREQLTLRLGLHGEDGCQ